MVPLDWFSVTFLGVIQIGIAYVLFIRGVTGWLDAATLAHGRGMEMSSHTFVEASAHLLCATPTAHWLEHMDVAGTLLSERFNLVNGTLTPPARPGLGIDWDEEAVEKYRVR